MGADESTRIMSNRMLLSACIKRIATGPHLSKDLSEADAAGAMAAILENHVHPVQAAVFLIALRMKRETKEENRGILAAIRAQTASATAAVDHLCDIADPYDGVTRQLPAISFIPPILAACGYPALLHGVRQLGPKFGITHYQVLAAAGIAVNRTPQQCAEHLGRRDIGWAYLDQSQYCPELYKLIELRNLLEKRTSISTCERLAGGVRGQRHNHLLIGYVHRGFESTYRDLASAAGYTSALIIRGMEGTLAPLLNKPADCLVYRAKESDIVCALKPADYGILSAPKAVPLPGNQERPDPIDQGTMAQAAAQAGMAALQGEDNLTAASLSYTAAMCLRHLDPSLGAQAAVENVRHVISSGQAWGRFAALMSRTGRVNPGRYSDGTQN